MSTRALRGSLPTMAILASLFFVSSPASAQPISPEGGGPLPEVARRIMRETPGAYDFAHAWKQQPERARENRRLLEQGLLRGTPEQLARMTAVSGVRKVPIFLAKYDDTGSDPIARGDLQQELFDGPWPTGTMTEYYDEISYGLLQLDGTVYDWVTLAEDDDYYVGTSYALDPDDAKLGEMIHEILDANDGSVNFADFDNDGPDGIPNSGDDDGFVDFIGIVHPEIGGEVVGQPNNNIWSHRWRLSGWDAGIYTTNDNAAGGGKIKIEDYTVMPALSSDGGMIEIGVFCHEFGHAFGLPDFYDTDPDDGDSEGIGHWGLMGAGNWRTPEHPAHMSAFEKAELGWLTPAVVTTDLNNFPILSSSVTPTALKVWKDGTPGAEYFLIENRTADGFDQDIRKPGLLIWHVNENRASQVNKDETNKLLDLESADQTGADHAANADDLDRLDNRSDSGDPFCEGDEFTPTTNPSSVAMNGVDTDVVITNIRGCGSQEMVVSIQIGEEQPNPNLCMRDCGADVCTEPASACSKFWASPELYIDNNEDGIVDPPAEGLPNKLFARVRNVGGTDASNVDVQFLYADPSLGLLFPSTGIPIDTANIPLIEQSGAETAMVLWDIPVPPATIGHYCVGVIATNAQDGQSSERAPEDNNVAQINIQELYAKAGSALPPGTIDDVMGDGSLALPAFAAPKADPPYTFRQTVQVCGTLRDPRCGAYELRYGSPPEFDDIVVDGLWQWNVSETFFQMGYGECVTFEVEVTNFDPIHGDRLELPLTLMCGDEAVGGTVLTFNIDNLPPIPPCEFNLTRTTPPPTDDAPGEKQLRVSFKRDYFDVRDFPETIERWRVYKGSFRGFPVGPGNLVAETAIDEDPRTGEYEVFLDVAPDESESWYAITAVDQAFNESEPCYGQVDVFNETVVDVPSGTRGAQLAQNVPNPFNPVTRIQFSLPTASNVELRVFDMKGRLVRELINGQRASGWHQVVWDGADQVGQRVSSGTYFYRLSVPGEPDHVRRMTLVK